MKMYKLLCALPLVILQVVGCMESNEVPNNTFWITMFSSELKKASMEEKKEFLNLLLQKNILTYSEVIYNRLETIGWYAAGWFNFSIESKQQLKPLSSGHTLLLQDAWSAMSKQIVTKQNSANLWSTWQKCVVGKNLTSDSDLLEQLTILLGKSDVDCVVRLRNCCDLIKEIENNDSYNLYVPRT